MIRLGRSKLGLLMTLLLVVFSLGTTTIVANDYPAEERNPMLWKQVNSPWSDIMIADSQGLKRGDKAGYGNRASYSTIQRYGCFQVSVAIQLARSGVVPEYFNPGDFVLEQIKAGSIGADAMALNWKGAENMSGGKFRLSDQPAYNIRGASKENISKWLDEQMNIGGYYPVIWGQPKGTGPAGTHFLAIDSVGPDGTVYVNDPASNGTVLFELTNMEQSAWRNIRLFEADTPYYDAPVKPFEESNLSKQEDIQIIREQWDGVSIPGIEPMYDNADELNGINMMWADSLTFVETTSLEDWRTDIETQKKMDRITSFGTWVMVLGILIVGYSLIGLFLSGFSKFLPIQIMTLYTFGRYQWVEEKSSVKNSSSKTTSQFYLMFALSLLLGLTIVSGAYFSVLQRILDFFV